MTNIPAVEAGAAEILDALANREWPLLLPGDLNTEARPARSRSLRAAIVFGNDVPGVSPDFLELNTPFSVRTSPSVESPKVVAAPAILLCRRYERRTEER